MSVEERTDSFLLDELVPNKLAAELAAMSRDQPCAFFTTITCNDSETPGVGPIRQAIEEYIQRFNRDPQKEKIHKIILQNHLNIMTSSWQRTIRYFLEYIKSDPLIFGPVQRYWAD